MSKILVWCIWQLGHNDLVSNQNKVCTWPSVHPKQMEGCSTSSWRQSGLPYCRLGFAKYCRILLVIPRRNNFPTVKGPKVLILNQLDEATGIYSGFIAVHELVDRQVFAPGYSADRGFLLTWKGSDHILKTVITRDFSYM